MYYKKKKPRNMATGGLMSQPPFIAKQDEEDNGINPYDVNTPESARQGLPSRLLSKKRTRFNKGGFPDLDGSGDTTMKDILIGRGVIKKAKGGIMDRQEYSKGDEAIRLLRDIDLPDEPPVKKKDAKPKENMVKPKKKSLTLNDFKEGMKVEWDHYGKIMTGVIGEINKKKKKKIEIFWENGDIKEVNIDKLKIIE